MKDHINTNILRPYRKKLIMHGLIYLAGVEQAITIKNISISGILVQFNSKAGGNDIKQFFKTLSHSSIIDLFISEMRMVGEAQVTRVDLQSDHILIALKFRHITYDVNDALYKRKAYRKNLPGSGQILIYGKYLKFNAVNVSIQGIMIRLNQVFYVAPGVITVFKYSRLDIAGEAEVIWVEHLKVRGILMGLQYINIEKSSVKGIPEFAWPLTA